MKEDEIVVIQVKSSTREKLKDLGNKRDTYDDIIIRLMEGNN